MKTKDPRKQHDHRLRVFFDERTGEVNIEGNKAGLEYLVNVCGNIINQPPGSNHWHLGEAFGTLDKQSLDLIICYRKDLEPQKMSE